MPPQDMTAGWLVTAASLGLEWSPWGLNQCLWLAESFHQGCKKNWRSEVLTSTLGDRRQRERNSTNMQETVEGLVPHGQRVWPFQPALCFFWSPSGWSNCLLMSAYKKTNWRSSAKGRNFGAANTPQIIGSPSCPHLCFALSLGRWPCGREYYPAQALSCITLTLETLIDRLIGGWTDGTFTNSQNTCKE